MILRRFTEHVSEQNWFAVFIDLVVVVVGIFLGLQVTDWNQARQDVRWEQAFLVDLRGDFERDAVRLQAVIDFQQRKGDKLAEVLEQLSHESVDAAGILQNFIAARSGNNTFFPANGVYESALTSGKIEFVRDKALRYRIMNLYGHHYTRTMYNGEIYDTRVETTSWESRAYFDVYRNRFLRWDDEVKEKVRAEFAFLSRENTIYMGLATALMAELQSLIELLPTEDSSWSRKPIAPVSSVEPPTRRLRPAASWPIRVLPLRRET